MTRQKYREAGGGRGTGPKDGGPQFNDGFPKGLSRPVFTPSIEEANRPWVTVAMPMIVTSEFSIELTMLS